MVKCVHGPDGCDDWLCYGYRGETGEVQKNKNGNKIVAYKPVTQIQMDWQRRKYREWQRKERLKRRAAAAEAR